MPERAQQSRRLKACICGIDHIGPEAGGERQNAERLLGLGRDGSHGAKRPGPAAAIGQHDRVAEGAMVLPSVRGNLLSGSLRLKTLSSSTWGSAARPSSRR